MKYTDEIIAVIAVVLVVILAFAGILFGDPVQACCHRFD